MINSFEFTPTALNSWACGVGAQRVKCGMALVSSPSQFRMAMASVVGRLPRSTCRSRASLRTASMIGNRPSDPVPTTRRWHCHGAFLVREWRMAVGDPIQLGGPLPLPSSLAPGGVGRVRGSTGTAGGDGSRPGVVVRQRKVAAKQNEIPGAREVTRKLDLKGKGVTLDAFHTQRETAQLLGDQGADYVLMVRGNQPQLQVALALLPNSGPPLSWSPWRVAISSGLTRPSSESGHIPDRSLANDLRCWNLGRGVAATTRFPAAGADLPAGSGGRHPPSMVRSTVRLAAGN